jgi:hypothetical protein
MKVKPYDNGVFISPAFLKVELGIFIKYILNYLWENSESQAAFMVSLDDF